MFFCLNFKVPENFFFLLHFAALSRYCVPTIFRMQVDGISCTDSNVAMKLLNYNALYNLSKQILLHGLIK